jgi:hypothetical protein
MAKTRWEMISSFSHSLRSFTWYSKSAAGKQAAVVTRMTKGFLLLVLHDSTLPNLDSRDACA